MPVPALAQLVYEYTGAPVPIPDNDPAGVEIAVTVSGLNAVTDVNVVLPTTGSCDGTPGDPQAPIAHPYVGDLVVSLRSPQGTSVVLINRRGGSRDNICGLTLDDDQGYPSLDTVTIVSGSPLSGAFAPDSPLSAFDGQDPNGLWILKVSDLNSLDIGELRRFRLILDTVPIDIQVDLLDDPVPGACTPGSCSLREAVALANAQPGRNRILLPAGTLQLTRAGSLEDGNLTGDLDVTESLELVGAGMNATTVTQASADRMFHVTDTADLGFRDMQLSGGDSTSNGGGVLMLSGGHLLVERVRMTNFHAAGKGGAIYHSGGSNIGGPYILLRDCVFQFNEASNSNATDAFGGALYSVSSGFNSNYMRVERCDFQDNFADNGGGALALDGVQTVSGNSVKIVDSNFIGNEVTLAGPGGAIGTNVDEFGLVYLSVIGSDFEDNRVPSNGVGSFGGAISLSTGPGIAIERSRFTGNSAAVGGAISGSFPTIADSTFCTNTATLRGGALSINQGNITLQRNTFCRNTVTTSDSAQLGGGAIANSNANLVLERNTLDGNVALRGASLSMAGGDLNMQGNTIVAGSPQPGGALGTALYHTSLDTGDTIVYVNNIMIGTCSYATSNNPNSALNNIEASGNGCRFLLAGLSSGNQIAVAGSSVALGVLADNGGPTQTRLPTAGSIAIDVGFGFSCTSLDQRGYQRNDVSCDIGAVEAGGTPRPDGIFASSYE